MRPIGPRSRQAVPIAETARGKPQGRAHGIALRLGQCVERTGHRPQHLVQRREREVGLGLNAGGPQHPHRTTARGRRVEQGGLARACLAPQHHRAAETVASPRDHLVECADFRRSAVKHKHPL